MKIQKASVGAILIVLALGISSPSFSAPGREDASSLPVAPSLDRACVEATKARDDFLKSQPNSCKADSDCGAYDYGTTCDGPVALPKSHETPEFAAALSEKVKAIQGACAGLPNSPACSPHEAEPSCRDGRCVNELIPYYDGGRPGDKPGHPRR